MYALLRSMAVRAPAAFFGALSFGLGGIYLSYINLLPILFCAAWLPLTCLFVRRFLLRPRRPRLRAGLALSRAAVPRRRADHGDADRPAPRDVRALPRLVRGARRRSAWTYAIPEMLSRVMFIGLMSIAAICVGAAQMIPAIDHVHDSARSRAFDFSLVSAWSMPWAKFARGDLSELPRAHVHRPDHLVLGRRTLSGDGIAVHLQHLLRTARHGTDGGGASSSIPAAAVSC